MIPTLILGGSDLSRGALRKRLHDDLARRRRPFVRKRDADECKLIASRRKSRGDFVLFGRVRKLQLVPALDRTHE